MGTNPPPPQRPGLVFLRYGVGNAGANVAYYRDEFVNDPRTGGMWANAVLHTFPAEEEPVQPPKRTEGVGYGVDHAGSTVFLHANPVEEDPPVRYFFANAYQRLLARREYYIDGTMVRAADASSARAILAERQARERRAHPQGAVHDQAQGHEAREGPPEAGAPAARQPPGQGGGAEDVQDRDAADVEMKSLAGAAQGVGVHGREFVTVERDNIPRSPEPIPTEILLLPHMGLGDMLVLRGMVGAFCADGRKVVVVAYRRNARNLAALFDDLTLGEGPAGSPPSSPAAAPEGRPAVALALVDDQAHLAAYLAELARGRAVVVLGDHSPDARTWRGLDPVWARALYLQVGMDPGLMRRGFRVPAVPQIPVPPGEYVLVHDDADRPLLLPAEAVPPGVAVIHVDDPRLVTDEGRRPGTIFAYVDLIRNAREVHAIDSCFALLTDLGDLRKPGGVDKPGTGERAGEQSRDVENRAREQPLEQPRARLVVHLYAKPGANPADAGVYSPTTTILRGRPARGAYGLHHAAAAAAAAGR